MPKQAPGPLATITIHERHELGKLPNLETGRKSTFQKQVTISILTTTETARNFRIPCFTQKKPISNLTTQNGFFFCERTKLSAPTSGSVFGGAPGEHHQTSESKKRGTHPSGATANSLAKERGSSACTSTRAVGCGLEGSARDPNSGCCACSAGRRVRPLEPSRWSQRRSTLHRLVTQRASGTLRPAGLRPDPPARGRAGCGRRRPQGGPLGSW